MKPKVFLSHTKKDKDFIVKIANDFRSSGIDVWFDEWEIPPGESLRKKIFEDGIPNCHVFFVYLTESSVESAWVKNELDSAFIHEIEQKNSFIILYVDKASTREKLSLDLKARNIPEFNESDYVVPFGKLISRTWSIFCKKKVLDNQKENDFKFMQLEKDKIELEKKLLLTQINSKPDKLKIKEKLQKVEYTLNEKTFNLFDILNNLKYLFADGCNDFNLYDKIEKMFEIRKETDDWGAISKARLDGKYRIYDFTGELIISGILEVSRPNEQYGQFYYLTKFGVELLN